MKKPVIEFVDFTFQYRAQAKPTLNNINLTIYEGEKVLTKRETDAYLKGQNAQGINITINGLTVREEADINKIANTMVRKLKEASLGYSSVGGMA